MSKGKKTIQELLEEAIVQEEEQPYEVPENWLWLKIKGIANVKGGKRLPKGHLLIEEPTSFPYLRVADFKDGSIDETELKYISEQTASKISRYVVSDEDVYISIAGTIGKTGIVPKHLSGANLTENAAKITDIKGSTNRFIHLALNSQELQNQIKQSVVSTSQPKLALFRIEDLKIPLPPFNEQKRIAEKVERLLSKIEEAKQFIEEARETFELRRAAILEKAFSGELLTPSFNKVTKKINKQITLEIPNHWEVKTLSEVVQNYNNKRIPVSQKKREEIKGDIPYYGATGIVDFVDGFTHEGEFVCIGEDGANLLSRSKPQAFIIRGKSWVNNHAHVVKMNDNMCNNYLMHYINFIPLNDYVTGTAQPKLNRNNLDKIPIVLPPANEQFAISQKIEDLLSKEKEIMKVCDSNLHGIDIIKQSIMNKAFRGELGTNDTSEENAIELLKEVLQEHVK